MKRDGSEFSVLIVRPILAGALQQCAATRFCDAADGSARHPDRAPPTPTRASRDVYRLDTDTGRWTLLSLGKPGDVVRWLADREGRRAGRDHRGSGPAAATFIGAPARRSPGR